LGPASTVYDWKCDLIEPSADHDSLKAPPPVLFRKVFAAKTTLAEARLYITAHGVYEAEINGKRVGDHILAPGWTVYDKELAYQTLDVLEHLQDNQESQHAIGVSVAEGWYAGRLGFAGRKHKIVRRPGPRMILLLMLMCMLVG
jgi:alpha-L-rhamnosidase